MNLLSTLRSTIYMSLLWASAAFAAPKDEICEGVIAAGGDCGSQGFADTFTKIANVLVFIVGAVAVILIIVGGLRYVLSAGDPKSTKEAKDTVLYAIVGVVVAITAYAMVNFVFNRFG